MGKLSDFVNEVRRRVRGGVLVFYQQLNRPSLYDLDGRLYTKPQGRRLAEEQGSDIIWVDYIDDWRGDDNE